MPNNLALQLQVIEQDTNLDNIMVGNSHYTDDVWDLSPFITSNTRPEYYKFIHFDYIKEKALKETIKQFAYYKLGRIKPASVRDYICRDLRSFIKYCSDNKISSFSELSAEDYI